MLEKKLNLENMKYYQTKDFNKFDLNSQEMSEYLDSFTKKFQLTLADEYNLINPLDIYKFILENNDLIELIQKIKPLLNKIFPNCTYSLEFVPDPEFESLNQLVIYVHSTSSFDKDWNLLKQLKKDFRNLKVSNEKIKRLLSVDLWWIMSDFDWKKFYDVGIHLKNFSNNEEYQRSAVGRFYYACFGLTKKYYENTHKIIIPSKDSHQFLINRLLNSIYEKENILGEYLQTLRKYRNFADYNDDFKLKNLNKTLKTSEDLINLIQNLKENQEVPIFPKQVYLK